MATNPKLEWQRTIRNRRRRQLAVVTSGIHLGAHDFATLLDRSERSFRVLEACKLATEVQEHITRSTLTVLGDDDLRHAMQVVSLFILIDVIVFRTVNGRVPYRHPARWLQIHGGRSTEVAFLRDLHGSPRYVRAVREPGPGYSAPWQVP